MLKNTKFYVLALLVSAATISFAGNTGSVPVGAGIASDPNAQNPGTAPADVQAVDDNGNLVVDDAGNPVFVKSQISGSGTTQTKKDECKCTEWVKANKKSSLAALLATISVGGIIAYFYSKNDKNQKPVVKKPVAK